MAQAIWILQYDLANGSEHQYLNWFHSKHIPEKLARPGYLWAAHYKGQIGAIDNNENKMSYLALFGGISTRAFLNPSPSELRGMQDDLTREMMGKRVSTKGAVFALEWSVNGPNDIQEPKSIQLDFFSIRADGNDEEIGAWAAKSLSSLAQMPDFNGSKTYKLISVTGGHYHGIVHNSDPCQTNGQSKKGFKPHDIEVLNKSVVEHFTGQRIWPTESDQ